MTATQNTRQCRRNKRTSRPAAPAHGRSLNPNAQRVSPPARPEPETDPSGREDLDAQVQLVRNHQSTFIDGGLALEKIRREDGNALAMDIETAPAGLGAQFKEVDHE